MTWQQKVQAWRALPEQERAAIRWSKVPRQVAASMAFEGEPVDLQWLKELHRRKARPVS